MVYCNDLCTVDRRTLSEDATAHTVYSKQLVWSTFRFFEIIIKMKKLQNMSTPRLSLIKIHVRTWEIDRIMDQKDPREPSEIFSWVLQALTVTSCHKPLWLKILKIVQYTPGLLPGHNLRAPNKLQRSQVQELHTSEPQCFTSPTNNSR